MARRKRRKKKEPWTDGFPCPKCGSYDTRRVAVPIAGGDLRVRNECGQCGKFLKWGGEPDELAPRADR